MAQALGGRVDGLLRALRAFEPGEYPGEDCAALVPTLVRLEKAAAAARTRAAARAAESNQHRKEGFADPSEWLSRPIPVWLARELARDAFLKAVIHDSVNIHTVAHFGRHIPAELRTALELGDLPDLDGAVCSEEGCDRRYGLEWDHDDPVAHGDETSYRNLDPKCRPHHWDKTEHDRRAGRHRSPPPRTPATAARMTTTCVLSGAGTVSLPTVGGTNRRTPKSHAETQKGGAP